MVLGQYIHPIRLCVGLITALLAANLYSRLKGDTVGVRLAGFAAASVVVYFATAGLYSIFACLCGIYEWGVKRFEYPVEQTIQALQDRQPPFYKNLTNTLKYATIRNDL